MPDRACLPPTPSGNFRALQVSSPAIPQPLDCCTPRSMELCAARIDRLSAHPQSRPHSSARDPEKMSLHDNAHRPDSLSETIRQRTCIPSSATATVPVESMGLSNADPAWLPV